MDTVSKSLLRFVVRSISVIALGLVIPMVWYLEVDPFRVVRHYDCYLPDPNSHEVRIGMNKGMVTFENLNDRRNEGRDYDSFIFGSSISCYYDAATWASLVRESIGDSGAGRGRDVIPYHLDSSSETLMSMARKVRWLDREGIHIRHALIVLDPVIMATEVSDGPAYLDPPQLHDSFLETVRYHYTFFRAGTNADFYKSYIPSLVRHKPVENGRNFLFERQPIVYDQLTNQETLPMWDSLIRVDCRRFYRNHPLKESPKDFSVSQSILKNERIRALEEICEVFNRQSTEYQIIVGPNRSKVTLNPSDLKLLMKIFEPQRVHDFSTSLAFLLEKDTMLYDNTHYRPPMAEIMMRMVYSGE